MRKLKIQVQMSIDGYVAGMKGETDWTIWNWDAEFKKYLYNLTRPVDSILLGHNYANTFIDLWQNRLNDPNTADGLAQKMVETQKVIFSRKLDKVQWNNARLVKGDLVEEINRLKSMKGRDMIAYGGLSFLSSLIKAGLVDEYNLMINPVLLGDGLSIFQDPGVRKKMDLVYSTSFECGITALCYIPVKNPEESTLFELVVKYFSK